MADEVSFSFQATKDEIACLLWAALALGGWFGRHQDPFKPAGERASYLGGLGVVNTQIAKARRQNEGIQRIPGKLNSQLQAFVRKCA